MAAIQVPDLANGSLYFATEARNSWTTEIQSVVYSNETALENPVFLGHECRREETPDGAPTLETSQSLLKIDSPGEFNPMIKDGKFFEIPSIDIVVPEEIFAPIGPKKIGSSYFTFPLGKDDWLAEADCPLVEAEVIPFNDLFAALNNKTVNLRKLFIRFRWTSEGTAFAVFAPCRYLNFRNNRCQDANSPPYLQPITGSVLLPFKNSYLMGYLVARCSEEGCIKSEFVTPKYVSAAPQMLPHNADENLKALCRKVDELMPAYSRIYNAVMPLDGSLDFFGLP